MRCFSPNGITHGPSAEKHRAKSRFVKDGSRLGQILCQVYFRD